MNSQALEQDLYDVTAPDGSKWTVGAPKGTDPALVLQYAKQNWQPKGQSQPMQGAIKPVDPMGGSMVLLPENMQGKMPAATVRQAPLDTSDYGDMADRLRDVQSHGPAFVRAGDTWVPTASSTPGGNPDLNKQVVLGGTNLYHRPPRPQTDAQMLAAQGARRIASPEDDQANELAAARAPQPGQELGYSTHPELTRIYENQGVGAVLQHIYEHGTGNPNIDTLLNWISPAFGAYKQATGENLVANTGISEAGNPWMGQVTSHLGPLVDPGSIAEFGTNAFQNPAAVPVTMVKTLLAPFEPGIDGPERFGKFLDALGVLAMAHGGFEALKGDPAVMSALKRSASDAGINKTAFNEAMREAEAQVNQKTADKTLTPERGTPDQQAVINQIASLSADHPIIQNIAQELGVSPEDVLNEAKFHQENSFNHLNPGGDEAPAATAEPATGGGGATGLARRFEDQERAARGSEPLPPQGIQIEELANRGQEGLRNSATDIESILDKRQGITEDDIATIAAYKRSLFNADADIQARLKTASPEESAALRNQLEDIQGKYDAVDQFARAAGGSFHKLGMALQLAYNQDFSTQALVGRAESIYGNELPKGVTEKLTESANQIAAAETGKEATAQSVKVEPQAASPKAQRNAIKRINELIGAQAESGTGFTTRKAGAVQIPIEQGAELQRNIRTMARHYASEGITDLEGIVERFKKDAPKLGRDQILSALSEEYRGFSRRATEEQIRVRNVMRELKDQADFESKTGFRKALQVAIKSVNDVLFGLKLTGHTTAPFKQGMKGLFTDPLSWAKSWRSQYGGLKGGYDYMVKLKAAQMESPFYERAKQAGLELTESHGSPTAMEENMARGFANKIPGLNKIFENSSAGFAGFLNDLRFQMFEKRARLDPNNPQYLRDVAEDINLMTGRSTSKVARGASQALGNVMFGPRYTVSKWEYTSGRAVWGAKTGLGAKVAAADYAKVAAGKVATMYAAAQLYKALTGGDSTVNTDAHDFAFGTMDFPEWGSRVSLFTDEGEPVKFTAQALLGKGSDGDYKRASGDVLLHYIQGKLSPPAGGAVAPFLGEYTDEGHYTAPAITEPTGNQEPFDWGQWFRNLIVPIAGQSVYEEEKKGAKLAPLAVAGIGARAIPSNR